MGYRDSKIIRLNKDIEGQNQILADTLENLEPAMKLLDETDPSDSQASRDSLDQALLLLGCTPDEADQPGGRETQLMLLLDRTQGALEALKHSRPVLPEHNDQLRILLDQTMGIADDATNRNVEKQALLDRLGVMLSDALDKIEGAVETAGEDGQVAENKVVSIRDHQETGFNRAVDRLQSMIAERTQLELLMTERENLLLRSIGVIENTLACLRRIDQQRIDQQQIDQQAGKGEERTGLLNRLAGRFRR